MHRVIQILLLLIFVAYGQQKSVAIINTLDDGEPPIKDFELDRLTDRLRSIALDVLPKKDYYVMTQENVVDRFGSERRAAKECKEATCLADLGRKVSADYIAQGRINRFNGALTIKVEIYNSRKSALAAMLEGEAKDVSGLLSVLEEKAPETFTGIEYKIEEQNDEYTKLKVEEQGSVKYAGSWLGPINKIKFGIGGGPGLYKSFEEDESFMKDTTTTLKNFNGFKVGLLTSFPIYVGDRIQFTLNPELYYAGPAPVSLAKSSVNIPLLITMEIFGLATYQDENGRSSGYLGSIYLEAGPQFIFPSAEHEIIGGIGFSLAGFIYGGVRFPFNLTDYSANALEVAIRILWPAELTGMLWSGFWSVWES